MKCTVLLACAAMLAACGGLSSKAQPEQSYVLNPAPAGAGAGAAQVPGALVIARPQVQPGLDSHRIMLVRAANELDHYALSRWSGPLPDVLQALAVQSLAGSFTTVTSRDRGAGAADYELLLTARHFEASYAGGARAPVVRVAFECLLTAARPRRVLGGCDVSVEEPAEDNRMSAIVAAFERAAQRAMAGIRTRAQELAAAQPAAGA